MAAPSDWMYHIHMKRTNLVLDEHLLEEAVRLSGERTYSRAVERALEEFEMARRKDSHLFSVIRIVGHLGSPQQRA